MRKPTERRLLPVGHFAIGRAGSETFRKHVRPTRMMKYLLVLFVLARVFAQTLDQLEAHRVSVAKVTYQGKSAIRLDALPDAADGESYAILKGTRLHTGTLRAELAGK